MNSHDLVYLFVFFGVLFGLVVTADLIRKQLHWQPEATRKFVHILTGIVVVFTPFVLSSKWPMIILGSLFTLLDYVGVKKHWFKGMHGTKRDSLGTAYYPLSFVVLVILFWDNDQVVLVAAMLIMAIADALAAIVGEKFGKGSLFSGAFEKKSIQGSLAMLAASFVIILSVLWFSLVDLSLLHIIAIAFVTAIIATASEIVSHNGSDNLTVPLGSAFVLHFLLHNSVNGLFIFATGMFLAFLIARLSLRVKFLTSSGAVGVFLLGSIVFGMGSWTFTIPILTFFILSSLISKMGKKRKQKLINIFEKNGERDVWQVLANGGLPGLFVIGWSMYPHTTWYLLYVAALAAVMADTWGTEIGVMSKRKPISVTSLKPVPMGTSGGITLMGTLGGILGAMILVSSAWLMSLYNTTITMGQTEIVLILVAAFLASLVDSLLGATIQAMYQCPVCAKITEKKVHCEKRQTILVKGYMWMNNDLVNIFCALSSALFVFLVRICL